MATAHTSFFSFSLVPFCLLFYFFERMCLKRKFLFFSDSLEELLEADKATDHAHSGMSLYSASWFNTQVRDQLLSISNKCEHLAKEVVTLKKDIASAEHKRSRQEDKATELVAEARKLTQDQADIQLAELRRR